MQNTYIREATQDDLSQIVDIYNHYIKNTLITFDEEPYTVSQLSDKILSLQKNYPVLVMHTGDSVLGYAYAAAWKAKTAYKHSAETTIYIHPDHEGKGLGQRLYNALLSSLALFEVVNAIACITIPNEASIKLHEKLGFKKIGRFDKVGYKMEQWVDVEYWQKHV
ncbi:MAG TPA: phosphinothricin acetyltransferase [Bacteroidetes bacterium]|nr:phosphinothricin acetyltransferase [Bacteroidota bacterium]